MTSTAEPRSPRPRRRLLRWLWAPPTAYLLAVVVGMEPALPFDVLLGAATSRVELDPELRAPADGRVRLVVLQHGLFRTPWSLWPLESALVAHGYRVLNVGYPSRHVTLATAAEQLADAVAAAVRAQGQDVELAFVGHSMGGLVVQEYLRRPDARTPVACVYIAVPHRGAILSDLRKHWWLFRLCLGDQSALQLSPGDPIHQRPIPFVERSGAIVGDRGAGNDAIPGDDDGTVGVDEATLAGAADCVRLPLGHTAIAGSAKTAAQVLAFLRHGRFRR